MPDLALAWNPRGGGADLVRGDEDLEGDNGLETAVLISLFCDKRAEDEDKLPGDLSDRRGWWADEFAEEEGDLIGSRRWLLDRSARRSDVPDLLEEYDREALAWLLRDKVASQIDVTVEVAGQFVFETITIYRPGKDPATFRFSHVWPEVGG